MSELTREQWCLSNQMISAIQCLNSIYCTDNIQESPIAERQDNYAKDIAKEIATHCGVMALEDAMDLISMAIAIKKIEKLDPTTEEKYQELIYEVCSVYPNESRHETARRYIRERETVSSGPCQEKQKEIK